MVFSATGIPAITSAPGELILKEWRIPTLDPYSYHAPPLPWIAHEWLAEVIMATIYSVSGLTGIVLFFALLLALIHWLLYRTLREQSNDIVLCTIVTLFAAAASSSHWLARPHVFSLLFTLIWCYLLNQFQYKNRPTLIYLPVIMLVWANLHGGFIIGFVLLSLYLAGNITAAYIDDSFESIPCSPKATTNYAVHRRDGTDESH